MTDRPNLLQSTDDNARRLARSLMQDATLAVLAFTDPDHGTPFVSRIGFGLAADGGALALVSELSLHTRALRANPNAALLLGEAGPNGDPLNYARLSLSVTARFVPGDAPERPALRQAWLNHHPKARLYIDFADFSFLRFDIRGAMLNAGFARAYRLEPADILKIDDAR